MTDIQPGYKQTEVGVIPEDWDLDLIENIAQITTGSKNTQDRKDDGEYPFFVRSQTVERINSYSFDGEAVLTAGDGVGTGKVFHYINGKFDAHQRVYRMSGFSERINGYYFYLYFSNHFYSRIMQMTAKSSVDSVRREMIAKMPIPLPPTKAEQEAIAEALSDTDALIESLAQLITKKRDIKQGAMQELLSGKKRLAEFGGNSNYKQTEIGIIPEDWVVCNVSDVTVGHKQGYYTKDKYVTNGIRLVRITDLYNPLIDYDAMPLLSITDKDYEQYKINIGDFLFARSGAIGRYGIVEGNVKGIFGSYIIRFNFDKNKLLNNFFGYLFETNILWKQLLAITQGSSNININANNIKALVIPLPNLKEQSAIAAILSDMDAEITALETKLTKTRYIKQGMMHNLLTGRIRLVG